MRSTLSTSAQAIASSMSWVTRTPKRSTSRGIRVLGPQSSTSAPIVTRPRMLEPATRLCEISPMIATLSPSSRPNFSRRVNMSSRAWVGCSWAPSPALMIAASTQRVRKRGTPADWWRTTTMSIFIAAMLRMVSLRVSPFLTELEEVVKLTESAERRFSASSKEMRVRVEGSKKRLTTVCPRRVGTLGMGRSRISRKVRAVSRMAVISAALTPSSPSRCFCCSGIYWASLGDSTSSTQSSPSLSFSRTCTSSPMEVGMLLPT